MIIVVPRFVPTQPPDSDRENWSQMELADKIGTNQNGISRLENPFYGKATLTTLKRVAAAFDVGLVVRFVPFSRLVNWIDGVPYTENGLSPDSIAGPASFTREDDHSNVMLGSLSAMAETKGNERLGTLGKVTMFGKQAGDLMPLAKGHKTWN